jgi:hypothetical protein
MGGIGRVRVGGPCGGVGDATATMMPVASSKTSVVVPPGVDRQALRPSPSERAAIGMRGERWRGPRGAVAIPVRASEVEYIGSLPAMTVSSATRRAPPPRSAHSTETDAIVAPGHEPASMRRAMRYVALLVSPLPAPMTVSASVMAA